MENSVTRYNLHIGKTAQLTFRWINRLKIHEQDHMIKQLIKIDISCVFCAVFPLILIARAIADLWECVKKNIWLLYGI